MKHYLFSLLLLLLSSSSEAASRPECMGFREDAWTSLEVGEIKMERGSCQDVIELKEGLYLMRYELLGKPAENRGTTVCHWRWVPDQGRHLEPIGDAPETIVCKLSP